MSQPEDLTTSGCYGPILTFSHWARNCSLFLGLSRHWWMTKQDVIANDWSTDVFIACTVSTTEGSQIKWTRGWKETALFCCLFDVPQNFVCSSKVWYMRLSVNWLRTCTAYTKSGLVMVKYINFPTSLVHTETYHSVVHHQFLWVWDLGP